MAKKLKTKQRRRQQQQQLLLLLLLLLLPLPLPPLLIHQICEKDVITIKITVIEQDRISGPDIFPPV